MAGAFRGFGAALRVVRYEGAGIGVGIDQNLETVQMAEVVFGRIADHAEPPGAAPCRLHGVQKLLLGGDNAGVR